MAQTNVNHQLSLFDQAQDIQLTPLFSGVPQHAEDGRADWVRPEPADAPKLPGMPAARSMGGAPSHNPEG